jgi:hypothetical protein
VHPNSRHSAAECHEIIKLVKRVGEWSEQTSKDGSPPRRRPGKERADDGDVAAGEPDLGYQSPEGVLKDVFTGDSDSGGESDRRKKLYVMYGESWELTSRRNVKSLRREVLSATPGVPKAAPHQWWRSTTISFGASVCPYNMAKAGILPLITAPVIANMQLHHVLIDGGAGLNVISHAAYKQLQDPRVPSRTLASILRSGHSTGVPPWEHHALGYIRDRGKLPHRECPVRRRGGQPPIQRHHWLAGPVPVHDHCPLRVFGPQDAIPGRGPHHAGLSHPVLEGKPNANYVRARIRTHVHSDYINEHHRTVLE